MRRTFPNTKLSSGFSRFWMLRITYSASMENRRMQRASRHNFPLLRECIYLKHWENGQDYNFTHSLFRSQAWNISEWTQYGQFIITWNNTFRLQNADALKREMRTVAEYFNSCLSVKMKRITLKPIGNILYFRQFIERCISSLRTTNEPNNVSLRIHN